MMNNSAITPATTTNSAISSIEEVLIGGDLSKLSQADRLMYYQRVCESLGLNPLTKPFDYIKLNNRLTLYANKDCANQLRALHDVSIELKTEVIDGIFIATASAKTKIGRSDSDIGCISIKNLSGEALSNAMMKAVTKAKRRVSLSICGLGWLDQTEVEGIIEPQAMVAVQVPATPTVNPSPTASQRPQQDPFCRGEVESLIKELNLGKQQIEVALNANFSKDHLDVLTDNQLIELTEYLKNYRTTSELLKELKWTPQQGQKFLISNFSGKKTRTELNLEEIGDFVDYLKSEVSN